jgi:hypothetical protein
MMEEQILKIVDKLFTEPFIDNYDCAKEIADHFREFMTWAIDEQEVICGELKSRYIINDTFKPFMTLDELYQYWNNEIKKK